MACAATGRGHASRAPSSRSPSCLKGNGPPGEATISCAFMTRTPPTPDLARVTLGVLVIGLLVFACLWILKPFVGAIVWASMLVIATWPSFIALQARLGGRRWLAILIMTLAMLLVIVLPLVVAAGTIVEHVDDIRLMVT